MADMRISIELHAQFNVEIIGDEIRLRYVDAALPHSSFEEREAMMMNSKTVVSALRRDVSFVWNAVIAVVFIGFAGLALAAAVLDVMAIRH